MIIGTTFLFQWYDTEDCTIELSRDGGSTWETIAANVITTDDGSVPLVGSYSWVVTGPESSNCVTRFTDNGDASTLLSGTFLITQAVLAKSTTTIAVGMSF
jgi:hypothetical protein